MNNPDMNRRRLLIGLAAATASAAAVTAAAPAAAEDKEAILVELLGRYALLEDWERADYRKALAEQGQGDLAATLDEIIPPRITTPEQAYFKIGELMCRETPGVWRGAVNRKHGFVLLTHDRTAPAGACGVYMEAAL